MLGLTRENFWPGHIASISENQPLLIPFGFFFILSEDFILDQAPLDIWKWEDLDYYSRTNGNG